MSLARPARCLSAASRSISSRHIPLRCIHRSARRQDDKPPSSDSNVPTIRKPTRHEQALARADRRVKNLLAKSRAYTPEERAMLEKKYTPEQMRAIDAGEQAVDMRDVARQGALRNDPMAIRYIDDFSKLDPVLDKKQKPEKANWDSKLRFKESEEFADEYLKFVDKLPPELAEDGREEELSAELGKFYKDLRMTVGKPEAELEPTDYSAPELPKLTDPIVRQQARESARDATDEMKIHYDRLAKQTGLSTSYMKRLRSKQLVSRRVVNQTRMGKIPSIYMLTVAGDGRGLLGIGEGKSAEADDARRQSLLNAIRNLTPIPRYEQRTIFGDVQGKSGATELTLYTRPPGFGVRCQGKVYEMAKCAGISDLASRVTRSRNPMNTVKACFKALLSQKDPEQISRARGRKLVDLRRVYYSGHA